jgi:hypothetical protein
MTDDIEGQVAAHICEILRLALDVKGIPSPAADIHFSALAFFSERTL